MKNLFIARFNETLPKDPLLMDCEGVAADLRLQLASPDDEVARLAVFVMMDGKVLTGTKAPAWLKDWEAGEANRLEKRLRLRLDDCPLLTFGYIGNFERWGDDRCLYIWIKGVTERCASGEQTASLWSCTATRLDRPSYSKAMQAIRNFQLGVKAAEARAAAVAAHAAAAAAG